MYCCNDTLTTYTVGGFMKSILVSLAIMVLGINVSFGQNDGPRPRDKMREATVTILKINADKFMLSFSQNNNVKSQVVIYPNKINNDFANSFKVVEEYKDKTEVCQSDNLDGIEIYVPNIEATFQVSMHKTYISGEKGYGQLGVSSQGRVIRELHVVEQKSGNVYRVKL